MEKNKFFPISQKTFWEIALYEVGNLIMKNNFLNNNGVSLLNTKKSPKTRAESQIGNLPSVADNNQTLEIIK